MKPRESQKIIIEQLSQDLEDLESFLKDLWEFLLLPICYVNPLFKILDINPASETLFGRQSIEMVGENIALFFADKDLIQQIFRILEKGKQVLDKEGEILTKEGERKIVNISASPRKDSKGNNIGYYFTFSDISELKKLNEKVEGFAKKLEIEVKERTKELEEKVKELEDSRRALMNILEDINEAREVAEGEKNKTLAIITNFADGLIVLGKENKITLINSEAERLLGVEAKVAKAKPLTNPGQPLSIRKLAKLLSSKSPQKELVRKEFPLEKPQRQVLEITTLSLPSGEERIVILHDITREKRIERMKTEFVSLSAHQLRTPLSAIKWTLKMLLDGDLGVITKEQREFIEKTYQSNERMIKLINDLLNVTRIEEGRYLYKPTFSQIENIVQSVISSLKPEIKKREIKLQFQKPREKLPRVRVDREKIGLAINNLLDNAIRYSSVGGRVIVSLKQIKDKIEFSVKDSGVGIPKDQQQRIFTKFFRGANAIRMETEGTGLGLFITKNIIEAHGGKIWFESEEKKGTTFRFTLPVEKKFAGFLKEF